MTVGWRGTHRCVSPLKSSTAEDQRHAREMRCKVSVLPRGVPPSSPHPPSSRISVQHRRVRIRGRGWVAHNHHNSRSIFQREFHARNMCLQSTGVTRSTWNRQTSTSSRRGSATQERTTRIRSLKTCFVLGALIGAQMPARWDKDAACCMFHCVCVRAQNTVVHIYYLRTQTYISGV